MEQLLIENIGAGLVGALIALALERLLDWRRDRKREIADVKSTISFLRGWFIEAVSCLDEVAERYDDAIRNWELFLKNADDGSKKSLVLPEMPYERFTMPSMYHGGPAVKRLLGEGPASALLATE